MQTIQSQHYLEPFLIYCPNESGMTGSEHIETGLSANTVHQAVIHWLQTGEDFEAINDHLRGVGIEPAEYWQQVDDGLEAMAQDSIQLEGWEVRDSGLVTPGASYS